MAAVVHGRVPVTEMAGSPSRRRGAGGVRRTMVNVSAAAEGYWAVRPARWLVSARASLSTVSGGVG